MYKNNINYMIAFIYFCSFRTLDSVMELVVYCVLLKK